MNVLDIKTIQDLTIFIKENTTAPEDDRTDRERAEWFLAVFNARGYSELRTKDIASMLLDGIPPITGVDDHANEIIDTFRVELDEVLKDGDEDLVEEMEKYTIEQWNDALEDHFGTSLTIEL